ncbi:MULTISPECIES: ABC transporter permease [Clostridium]|uniref:ABC transporter permease n=1 Tax=Clostridium TaxID=1485 RepID=UPI0005C25F5E|nr:MULTISPECIES: ABC transporter permease [Clostridium]KIU08623.1 ABC-type transport system, involved in lipoprotein release, permease component [Clostridium butyricum]MBA8968452.1 putative ABC transport system permease protein [Clostridium butyricum]MBA8970492.1 putative ABC transport system permease protein [Clostridium butyricum]MBC2426594.1 FtsX-like permease family protein [Clostridium butyricum]MDU1231963.1 ABC transporter permease [Clostridium sp.]
MFIKENIMLAIAGLKSNKMRAVLTMLGIIIGIGSVIGIVSVGNAMTANVTSSMANMGSTNVTINVTERDSTSTNNNKTKTNEKKNGSSTNEMPGGGSPQGSAGGGMPGGGSGGGMPGGGGGMPGGGMGGHSGRFGSSSTSTPKDSDLLTMSQIKELEENFGDEIDAFSVTATKDTGKAKSGTAYANVNITGTNPGYEKVKNIEMADGRYITDTDVDGSKMVAVVSDKLVSKIFGEGVDPIGQEVKIYTSSAIHCYTIVGVYTYKSSGGSTESEEKLTTDLYIPVTAAKSSSSNKNYQTVTIRAKDNVDITTFTTELQTYLDKLYIKNTKYKATASNMESMLESMTSMTSTMALAISAIAAISLLVGGIGVMNIMLVSVTERTREIGTRKALGAKSSHIKMQFIVESMIICAIGGIIGIVLGIIIGVIGAHVMGNSPVISPMVIVGSFTFSMVIGIFFGYYPAKKAAGLDPIEALRYE